MDLWLGWDDFDDILSKMFPDSFLIKNNNNNNKDNKGNL